MRGGMKAVAVLGLIALALKAGASQNDCSALGLEQAFPAIGKEAVAVCFLYTKTPPDYEGQKSQNPDGIAVYSVAAAATPTNVYELPYAGTVSEINEVFVWEGVGGEQLVFVLYSFVAPMPWDVIGDIYGVAVVRIEGKSAIEDAKLTRFFGFGGDLISSGGQVSYVYPYKDKAALQKVIRSELFRAVSVSEPARGKILERAALFGGEAEPDRHAPTKMYLIAGDRVSVVDSTEGWCKISYLAAKKAVKWLDCKLIRFDADE
jgi:hypothetical protein